VLSLQIVFFRNKFSSIGTIFDYKKINSTEWIGAEGTLLLREIEERSRPHRAKPEEARLPPRGKKVPGAERNGPSFHTSLIQKMNLLFGNLFKTHRQHPLKTTRKNESSMRTRFK